MWNNNVYWRRRRESDNMIKKISHRTRYEKTLLVELMFCMAIFLINFVSAVTWDNTAYYKFDEGTGTVLDATGNNNNGTNHGAVNTSGIINFAYDSFDNFCSWNYY